MFALVCYCVFLHWELQNLLLPVVHIYPFLSGPLFFLHRHFVFYTLLSFQQCSLTTTTIKRYKRKCKGGGEEEIQIQYNKTQMQIIADLFLIVSLVYSPSCSFYCHCHFSDTFSPIAPELCQFTFHFFSLSHHLFPKLLHFCLVLLFHGGNFFTCF